MELIGACHELSVRVGARAKFDVNFEQIGGGREELRLQKIVVRILGLASDGPADVPQQVISVFFGNAVIDSRFGGAFRTTAQSRQGIAYLNSLSY